MCVYIYICGRDLWGLFRSFACKHVRSCSFPFSSPSLRGGAEEKRRRGEEEKKEERRKGKAKGEGEGREKGERRKEKGNLILLLETTSVVCAIYRFPLHSICQVFPG